MPHIAFPPSLPEWMPRGACNAVYTMTKQRQLSMRPCMRTQHRRPLCVQELHHKNRYWHEDCFRCAKCAKSLASESFSARDDGKIMCGKCGAREDGNRCQGCYKVVLPGGWLRRATCKNAATFDDL